MIVYNFYHFRVYSFPAKSVSLGKFSLEKPNDENYTEFWVDFNGGSERMTLFCNQEAESQVSSLIFYYAFTSIHCTNASDSYVKPEE